MNDSVNLPYRKNVSMIAFCKNKFLLVNSSYHDYVWWKFPQGGIDHDEDIVVAALREFSEELGCYDGRVVGISELENFYDWPSCIVKKSNYSFRGQHQKFVLLELPEDVILTPDPFEVEDYLWVSKEELLRLAHESKHSFSNYNGVIQKIISEFAHVF